MSALTLTNITKMPLPALGDPLKLFSAGEKGDFWEAADLSKLFQDTAAATPAVLPSDPIGRVNGKTTNGNFLIQATAGNRLLLKFDETGNPYFDMATARGLYSSANFDLSSTSKVTVLAVTVGKSVVGATASFICELTASSASFDGSFYLTSPNASSVGHGWGLRGSTSLASYNVIEPVSAPTGVVSAVFDTAGATKADQIKPRVNLGLKTLGDASAATGAGNFANSKLNVGGRNVAGGTVGFPFGGRLYSLLIIGRALTDSEIAATSKWMLARAGFTLGAIVGDSLNAIYPADATSIDALVPKLAGTLVAVAGNTIAQQKAAWLALDSTVQQAQQFVDLQIGQNDLTPAAVATTVIAALQDLVTTIRGTVNSNCKIIVTQLTPAHQRWINLYGGTNGPLVQAKWVTVNDAIAGLGPNPITGVDGRVTSHVALMGDTDFYLRPEYESSLLDGIHDNTAGRIINATAKRLKYVELGLMRPLAA